MWRWWSGGRWDALLRINATAGRDHWNSSGFALFAGGGLKMGQGIVPPTPRVPGPARIPMASKTCWRRSIVFSASTSDATIPNHTGRPIYLLDDRAPIAELL